MTDQQIASLKRMLGLGERFAWVPDDSTPFSELSHVGNAPGGVGCDTNQEPGPVAYIKGPMRGYIALDNVDVEELVVLRSASLILASTPLT